MSVSLRTSKSFKHIRRPSQIAPVRAGTAHTRAGNQQNRRANDYMMQTKRRRRNSTAWHQDTKPVTLVETKADKITKYRESEFHAWEQDPHVRQLRKCLLILCWIAVLIFTCIPGTFAVMYATTFSEDMALAWYGFIKNLLGMTTTLCAIFHDDIMNAHTHANTNKRKH